MVAAAHARRQGVCGFHEAGGGRDEAEAPALPRRCASSRGTTARGLKLFLDAQVGREQPPPPLHALGPRECSARESSSSCARRASAIDRADAAAPAPPGGDGGGDDAGGDAAAAGGDAGGGAAAAARRAAAARSAPQSTTGTRTSLKGAAKGFRPRRGDSPSPPRPRRPILPPSASPGERAARRPPRPRPRRGRTAARPRRRRRQRRCRRRRPRRAARRRPLPPAAPPPAPASAPPIDKARETSSRRFAGCARLTRRRCDSGLRRRQNTHAPGTACRQLPEGRATARARPFLSGHVGLTTRMSRCPRDPASRVRCGLGGRSCASTLPTEADEGGRAEGCATAPGWRGARRTPRRRAPGGASARGAPRAASASSRHHAHARPPSK